MTSFEKLDAMIRAHDAWKNRFFEACDDGLPLEMLRKVCPEYLYLTAAFPGILAHLVSRTCGGAQFHLVSILYSELGSGVEYHAHSRLFRILCEEVGAPDLSSHEVPRLRSTRTTVDGLRGVYRDSPLLESMGAQYALECQADNMLRKFRRAFVLFDRSKAGESEGMTFFKVHETDEPQHTEAMQKALLRCMKSEGQLTEIQKCVQDCLDLLAGFWNGLYKEISRGQPVG